jgi:hypothetical protein
VTRHEICEQARNVPCVCGAPPGCPCVAAPRHWHASRFAHARRAGLIGFDEIAYVIRAARHGEITDDPGAAA